MFKLKILFLVLIFSFSLIVTSFIKNQTREIEKKILYISKKIHIKEKDLNESQLDFFYLSSPSIIEKKIENLDSIQYFPMDYSKIYLDLNSFISLKNKFVIKKNDNQKKE